MRRRWLLLILVLTSAVVLARLSAPRIVDAVRQRAERELSAVFHAPAHIGSLRVSVVPLRLRVSDVDIGGAAPTLKIGAATLRVRLIESARRARIAAQLSAHGVFLNIDGLPKPQPSGAGEASSAPTAPMPFEISATRLEDVTVQFFIDHEPVNATAPLASGRAGMSRERPYLTFAVQAPGAALQRGTRRLTVSEVDLRAGVLADQFFVDHWTIRGDQIALEASGQALPPSALHRIVGNLPFDALGVIFEPLAQVSGALHVDGTCRGELFDPVAEADVQLSGALVLGEPVGDVHATLTRRGRELALANVEVSAWGGTAAAEVNMTVGGTVPMKGEVVWRDVDAALIGHLDRPPHQWSAVSQGKLTMTGDLNPLALTLKGEGTLDPRVAESTALSGRWTAQLNIAEPEPHGKPELRLKGAIEQGTANHARVTLALARDRTVSGTIEADLGDVAKLAPLTPPPLRDGLSGSINGKATIAGPLLRPTFAGDFNADRLTIFGATIPQLRGGLEWTGAQLSARAVELTTATGSGTIDGRFALSADAANDWRIAARNLDLSPLMAAADFLGLAIGVQGGVVDGTASCRGAWATAQLDADLIVRRFWLWSEPMHQLALRAQASRESWSGELRLDHTGDESLTLTANGLGARRVQATIESTPWQLGHLRGSGFRGLDGSVRIHGTVDGPIDRLDGSLRLDGRGLTVGDHQWGDALLTAQGNSGDWTAEARALGEALQLHATWRVGKDWPFTIGGELARTDIATLLWVKSSIHLDAAAALNLHGHLTDWTDIGGELRVQSLTIARQSYAVQATEPIVLRGEHGRFEVLRCAIADGRSRVEVTGTIATSGTIDLKVSGEGDLELFELLIGPVESARGRFTIAAGLRRSGGGTWNLTGSATVSDGAIDFGLAVVVTKMEAAFSLTGGRVVIEDLAAQAGGGTIRVGGSLDLNGGPDMWWSVREVALPLSDALEARISSQGKLTGAWDAPRIGGDVEVLNALYDRDVELSDWVPWLQKYLVAAPQAEQTPRPHALLDLRIYAHDGVFIDNNFAKVELWLNLQATGTTETPVVSGTIGFLSGEVVYQQRTFTITGGSIDFRDPLDINPLLNITAESQISTVEAEYTVRVVVSGTAKNPRVQFSADDPSLSQNDVLSLVALGKTAAQFQREGGKVSPGSALAYIPTGSVEQRVRQFSGLDRFEVDTDQTRDTGTIEPRITVGKDLTEELRVLASTTFGVESRRAVQLEYRLTTRFSLLSSWESDSQSNAGAFGGGVKWRYEFRRLPFSLRPTNVSPAGQGDAR